MPRALRVGTDIRNQQYRVEKVLGEGGFGVTYKVWDYRNGRIAALKEFFPANSAVRVPGAQTVVPTPGNESSFERFRQDFINEAQTIHTFQNHPNVVSVYHLFAYNNTAYYAMEYVDGSDLQHYLNDHGRRVSWEVLRPMIAQCVMALHALHQREVIHCDISADNIYVTNDGTVKLLDFGAVRTSMSAQTDIVLVRRGYTPLEQYASNGKIGPWTDVYALAATIYTAITGDIPPEATERQNNDPIRWPSQRGIREPYPGWEAALRKGMELHYANRYQTVQEFWAALTRNYSQEALPQTVENSGRRLTLKGIRGLYAGQKLNIQDDCRFGVDASQCEVTYPIGTPGVSRSHLQVWRREGSLMALDRRSTYGTRLNGREMVRGVVYVLEEGSVILFGDDQEFQVVQEDFPQQAAYTVPIGYSGY